MIWKRRRSLRRPNPNPTEICLPWSPGEAPVPLFDARPWRAEPHLLSWPGLTHRRPGALIRFRPIRCECPCIKP